MQLDHLRRREFITVLGSAATWPKHPPAKPGALVLEPLKAAYPCRASQASLPLMECSTPHELLNRCSLGNLQFPAIALTRCGLTSHGRRSPNSLFMSLAAHDLEFPSMERRCRPPDMSNFCCLPCRAVAEPGDRPLGFRVIDTCRVNYPCPGALIDYLHHLQGFSW
jgi:hypothetical protein